MDLAFFSTHIDLGSCTAINGHHNDYARGTRQNFYLGGSSAQST